MDLILIILVLVLLFGGGFGYRRWGYGGWRWYWRYFAYRASGLFVSRTRKLVTLAPPDAFSSPRKRHAVIGERNIGADAGSRVSGTLGTGYNSALHLCCPYLASRQSPSRLAKRGRG